MVQVLSPNKACPVEHILKKTSAYTCNEKLQVNGIQLLKEIKNDTIKVCFFDPQYRGVLDKLNYGNEGERQIERAALTQMSEETIQQFCEEINRTLMPSGYLFLWVDKFHLLNDFRAWFKKTKLQVVDMITWNKGRMGMGYRTRRQCEYLIVLQKDPVKSKGTWHIKNIRDVWEEKIEEKIHAHQKPYGLQKSLIECVSKQGDVILDPAAGSFTILDLCKETDRTFIGCDLYVN